MMTDLEMRQAIAKECGWTDLHFWKSEWRWRHPVYGVVKVPDFCNDLNAIQDAVLAKFITDDQRNDFIRELDGVASRDANIDLSGTELTLKTIRLALFPTFVATAKQRAEAFLRAVGKWEEEAHT